MLIITREQARELDRRSIEEFGIPEIVLVENAARAVAQEAKIMVQPTLEDSKAELRSRQTSRKKIYIFCGGGNNGADGLAAARHLAATCEITIVLINPSKRFSAAAELHLNISRKMQIPMLSFSEARDVGRLPNLLVDALLGTGAVDPPRPAVAEAITWMNASGVPILSVDVPSGWNCDLGQPNGPCVRAKRTVTMAAPKVGFNRAMSREFTGTLRWGDIGCPFELLQQLTSGTGFKRTDP